MSYSPAGRHLQCGAGSTGDSAHNPANAQEDPYLWEVFFNVIQAFSEFTENF